MKKAVSFGKEKHEDEEAVMLLLLLLLFLSLSWSETTERWNLLLLLLLLLLLMFLSALSLPLFLTTVFVCSTWIQFSPAASSKGLPLLRRDESQTMNWDCNLLLFSLLLVEEEDDEEEEPASTASSGRLLWFMMMIFLVVVVWRVRRPPRCLSKRIPSSGSKSTFSEWNQALKVSSYSDSSYVALEIGM